MINESVVKQNNRECKAHFRKCLDLTGRALDSSLTFTVIDKPLHLSEQMEMKAIFPVESIVFLKISNVNID